MLKPSYLEQLPEPVVDLVSELENEIIADITARVVKGNYNTPSTEWLTYKANQFRLSSQAVNRIIAKKTGETQKVVRELYTEAVKTAIEEDVQVYGYAVKDGIISDSGKLHTYFRSVAFNNIFRKGLQNTNTLMRNLTNSMAKAAGTSLIHAMDLAWLETASGAYTPDEAVYKAVKKLMDEGLKAGKKLTDEGLREVSYKSGRKDQVDVAVRRAVRTSINKTCCDMQLDLAGEMGCDLVEVTSHFGARPTHAEWQGQVYSLSGKNPKYKPFSVTGYGTGEGLGGWNCRHSFHPYFEGLSERASKPSFTKEENDEYYKLTQKQRAMERAIRKTKRDLAVTDSARQNAETEEQKAAFDKDFARQSAVLKRQEQRLDSFIRANGLAKDNSRVRVAGFGKSVSQKAVHAAKKRNAALQYSGISISKTNVKSFSRQAGNISARKVDGIFHNIYISDKAAAKTKKQQTLHRADVRIGKALKKMNINESEFKTEIIIVSSNEMPLPGAYNPVTDTMYLNEGLFDGKVMRKIQSSGVKPNHQLSTIIHELMHRNDAEDYRRKYGFISSTEDLNEHLNDKFKKELDKLGIVEYNVGELSSYSKQMYEFGNYFEVYTEYRTLKKLER